MVASMSPRKPLSAAARSIGVSMNPGGTALTVMPLGPYSSARVFVSPLTADFAATYGDMYGAPECVLEDEMLTMRPQPASSMSGSTAWMQWKTPLRLTSMTRCHRSNETSWNFLKLSRPAALTRIDTGPSCERMPASASSTWARSVTSAAKANSSSPGLRSMIATW